MNDRQTRDAAVAAVRAVGPGLPASTEPGDGAAAGSGWSGLIAPAGTPAAFTPRYRAETGRWAAIARAATITAE